MDIGRTFLLLCLLASVLSPWMLADSHVPAPVPNNTNSQVAPEAIKNYEEDLGSSMEEPIANPGILIWDGKYVEPPYVVSRKGRCIYINNKLIYSEFFTPDSKIPIAAPSVPKEITRDSTRYDKNVNRYIYDLFDWALIQFKDDETKRSKAIVEGCLALPCMKSAVIQPGNRSIVLSFYSDANPIQVERAIEGYERLTLAEKARRIEGLRQREERRLAERGCVFVFSQDSGSGFFLSKEEAALDLKAVIAISRSNRAEAEKFELLQRLEWWHHEYAAVNKNASIILANLAMTPALEKHLDTLIKGQKITPRTVEDVQKIPRDNNEPGR